MKRRNFLIGTAASALTLREAQAAFNIYGANRTTGGGGTTTYTATGPSTGTTGLPSTNFTVAIGSGVFSGTQTITIVDSPSGGTFTPSAPSVGGTSTVTVTPTVGTTSFTFTYNAASNGLKTLTFSDGQGWIDPTPLNYTASGGGGGGVVANIPLGNLYPVAVTSPNATKVNNADGTTVGVTATQFTALTGYFTFPADDVYTFTVKAFPTLAATKTNANMIQVWVSQLAIPADPVQPAATAWSLFATSPVGGPATDYVFRASVEAGNHPIGVALCTAQNNSLNPSDNSQAQGVHGDRLIITATGAGIPAEPAGSRDPFLQPGSSLHYSRIAHGSGASWGNDNQTVSSGSYNTTTGVITLNLAAALPFIANQPSGVSLISVAGTGTNLTTLNGNWPCLTSSGSTVTLQGPANEGAITITGGIALDADMNVFRGAGTGVNLSLGSFSNPFYQGQSGDGPGTWLTTSQQNEFNLLNGTNRIAITHLPTGMSAAGGSDGAITVADVSNKRYFYSGSNAGSVSGTDVTVGAGNITDSYNLNHALIQSGSSTTLGLIRFDDVVNVGAINHSLYFGFVYAMGNDQQFSTTTGVGWPNIGADYPSAVHPQVTQLVSGTYNSTTGALALTCATNLNYAGGGNIYGTVANTVPKPLQVYNLTGTGANLSLLNSVFIIQSISGSVINITAPTGLGTITITGGTVRNAIAWCQWGAHLGIPASTPKPGGLNAGASMLWDCAQRYGFISNNQAGNAYQQTMTFYADISLGGNTTMNQIISALPSTIDACCVLRNNGPTTIKGGGSPIVAQQPGLIARSTFPVRSFAPPPPSPAVPFPVANSSYNNASGVQLTTIASVPIGSLIFLAIDMQGAVTSITDNATGGPNTYVQCITAPTTGPNISGQTIWACLSTTNTLPVGSKITINVASGVWSAVAHASTASGGLDKTNQAVSTTSVTSFSLAAGTTTTANQLVIGTANTGVNGGSFVGNQPRINTLPSPGVFDNNHFISETYAVISSIQSPVYNPFWTSGFSAPYAACIATFKIP